MLQTDSQLALRLESPLDALPKVEQVGALRVAGLFAGIGGIELGLSQAGHRTEFLCELEPAAAQVLQSHFEHVHVGDVGELDAGMLPQIDLLAGGFPCQDLSQAGRTEGIDGSRSGLVGHMFRLLNELCPAPSWVLFENVPFMLQLDGGRAMAYLTETLASMGWVWAYRVVDSRAFGLPQRRQRVIFVASKTHDPRSILFADNAIPRTFSGRRWAHGFYWTEGRRGLGWAVNAVPTLKGGSSLGIPSPPGIWMPDGSIVTPSITDAERLQGFQKGWTKQEAAVGRKALGARWKMVGNAVTVRVAKWVGDRFANPGQPYIEQRPLAKGRSWPMAGWGRASEAFEVDCSTWPLRERYSHLAKFVRSTTPLSLRATEGFRSRTRQANLNFDDKMDFLDALDNHIEKMRECEANA